MTKLISQFALGGPHDLSIKMNVTSNRMGGQNYLILQGLYHYITIVQTLSRLDTKKKVLPTASECHVDEE